MKNSTRITAIALAGGLIALAAPTAAHAHVSATATSTAAGSSTVVTFSVPHGCEGSPTQIVTIDIPDSVPSVTPTVTPLWSVEKVTVPLDEPIESAHGGEPITERVGQIVYTSTSGGLADGFRDSFELSLRLPEGEAGDSVEFPVTQSCTEGTAVWEGQDAPRVVLTAATAEGGHGGQDTRQDDDAHQDESAADAEAAPSADLTARILGVVGIVVGIAGIAVALITRRAARAQA